MKEKEITPRLYRRRDAAGVLALSESMLLKLERRGLLKPLKLDEVGRTVRYDAREVDALADRLIRNAQAD